MPLPALYEGLQRDELDVKLFENATQVLKLYGEGREPWVDILMPMATKHCGLMHSVLCLSATHLLATDSENQAYLKRREYHYGEALDLLQNGEIKRFWQGDKTVVVKDGTTAQCIVMHLASVADSRPGENFRIFSGTARELFKSRKATNPDFHRFMTDFFMYHDVCSSITNVGHKPLSMDDFQLPEYMLPPEACTFLGVMDGVFPCISNIKQLRDRMRERWASGLNVDPMDWSLAAKIEMDLQSWVGKCENDSGLRRVIGMLYQHVTWLYLHRTINQPNEGLKTALETGLRYYRMLSEENLTLNVMLMPLFLLGCSAFWPEHRPEITEEFEKLQAYSNLGNIQNAKTVVEEVWSFMDANDARCWDWEAIMEQHGWEFLIT